MFLIFTESSLPFCNNVTIYIRQGLHDAVFPKKSPAKSGAPVSADYFI
jgi:hypothetical protein